jgi:GNAT superfamily N-acetyltransferase
VKVRRVAPEVVRPLRQAVLRPHQTLADQVYPGDAVPGAAHFAAYDGDGGDAVVGVASIGPEGHPVLPRNGDWRIRGMATAPEARGRGAGAALLAACLSHAGEAGAVRVWCNARSGARAFYERAGFVAEGAEFELPEIGPHVRMSLVLEGASRRAAPHRGR